jgi:hypothetical protein
MVAACLCLVQDESGEKGQEGSDKEFAGSEEDSADEEDTIAEQEKHEKRQYASEIKDLEDEGERLGMFIYAVGRQNIY